MAFNPASPLGLNYIQQQTTISQQVVEFSPITSVQGNIEVLSLPVWLTATNIFYNSTNNKIYFTLKVNNAYAASMQPGEYNDTIKVRYRGGSFSTTYTSNNYTVILSVIAYTPLQLNPTVFPFTYLIGGSNPQNQTLNITSSSNWTIVASQSWVTLSQTTGVNSGQIFVGVDPSGLSVGQYSAILTVQDFQTTRQATVTLNVTEGDTINDFLYVNPQNLEFVSELGVANTTTKQVAIEASGSWSASASESWVNLSANSGSSGITNITVSVDSVALTDLDVPYLAQITFTQDDLQKTIYVQLYLVEFLTQGLESEGLYFSDDRNRLQITNIQPNMYLYLEGTLNNGSQNIIYQLNAPYQNGIAKVLVGLETNVMLKSVTPTSDFTSRIKNNISPVVINFVAYNKQQFSGGQSTINNFSNVRFLTGKTPTEINKLCYIPSTIHVTKNAVLSLSCLSTDALTAIEITGDVTATLSSVIADNLLVYNAIVNLTALDLEVGNSITITFGDVTLNVVIKPEGLEQNILAIQNEWKEYEFFECTGALKMAPTAKQTTTELADEATKHTKIVSIDSGVDYEINTGDVYSQDEIDWLSKILDSKRVFIYRNGEPVEIILSTNSLDTYETRRAYSAFKLKFKKAIVS